MKVHELRALLNDWADDALIEIVDECGQIHSIADVYEGYTPQGVTRYLIDMDPQ